MRRMVLKMKMKMNFKSVLSAVMSVFLIIMFTVSASALLPGIGDPPVIQTQAPDVKLLAGAGDSGDFAVLMPLDVSKAVITSSPADIGSATSLFDGDPGSVMRSAAVNPCFVQVNLPEKQSVSVVRVLIGQPGVETDVWHLEAADTEADLINKTGSYIVAVSQTDNARGAWKERNITPIERKIWRFTVQKINADDYVHIYELELCGNVKISTAPPPEGLTVDALKTTAILKWNRSESKNTLGYAVFRKKAGGEYPREPVWTTIAGDNSDKVMFNDHHLSPNTAYVYKIASYARNGVINSDFSEEVSITTLPSNAEMSRVANLRVLVAIYTHGMTPDGINRSINSFTAGIEFFYRNSKGRLNLEPTYIFLDGKYSNINSNGEQDDMVNFVFDLNTRGVRNDQFDGFFLIAEGLPGYFGGYQILGNTYGGLGYATYDAADSPYCIEHRAGKLFGGQVWTFIHEFGHALDFLSDQYAPMLFNHPPWAFPLPDGYDSYDAGENFSVMATVLRTFAGYDKYGAPHDGYIEFIDNDKDGMANSDTRLAADEHRFGSNPLLYDSDNDGLNDLQEYYAGIYKGSDPNNPDTDEDGVFDGFDQTPLSDFSPFIKKFSAPPPFNGNLGAEWTRLTGKPVFTLDKLMEAVFYSGWDDNYLYMAVTSNKKIDLWFSLDASGQNGRFETDGVFAGFTDWEANKYSPTAYGDCYSGEALLFISADSKTVQKRIVTDMASGVWSDEYYPVADSAVFYAQNGNTHTMMIKIPKALGPGIGYSYWKPGTPVTDGLQLSENRVLGFWLTYAAAGTSKQEHSGDWSSINEPLSFYKSKLVIAPITVNATAATGGKVSGGGGFLPGAQVTLAATPNTGYAFAGWYENGAMVSKKAAYLFKATANRTLEARFAPAFGADAGSIWVNDGVNNKPFNRNTTEFINGKLYIITFTRTVNGVTTNWTAEYKADKDDEGEMVLLNAEQID